MHLLRPAQGRAAKLNIARRSTRAGYEHVRDDPREAARVPIHAPHMVAASAPRPHDERIAVNCASSASARAHHRASGGTIPAL